MGHEEGGKFGFPKETKLYDSSKDVTLKLNDVKFWRRMVLEESRIQSACKEIWTNIKVGVFFLSLKNVPDISCSQCKLRAAILN